MQTTIGSYNSDLKQVEVTFVHAGVTHVRPVNACLAADGSYDEEATAERVASVADGVAVKIEVGAIVNLPDPEEPEE